MPHPKPKTKKKSNILYCVVLQPMKQRIHSIDIVRGLIMVIMTLDHVRDFLHYPTSPLNLKTTTTLLFFTRWITHFCAPTFVFLAGVSAVLAGQRRSKEQLSAFLIKRGAWLILSDLLIITFIFTFDPGYHVLVLEVLAATGVGMLILSLLIWTPNWLIAAIGFAILLGHNLLPHEQGLAIFNLTPQRTIYRLYSFIPWTGILLLGYIAGQMYRTGFDAKRRQRILLITGISTIAVFLILRTINSYGDPSPWSTEQHPLLSFLNTTKQPPSLLFATMTLGPILLLLSLAENSKNNFFRVFGNVPYFYFILHLLAIRILNLILIAAANKPFKFEGYPLVWQAENFGVPLWTVYLIWLSLILLLYFPCRWYMNYKKSHNNWWLSYI